MAVTDNVNEILGGFFSGSINVMLIILGVFLVFFIVGGLIWYYFVHRKKFDITVKIVSERTGDARVFFDMAAVIYDRKNKEYLLKLRNLRKEIELPSFRFITHTNKGDYIELLRRSERDFTFLTPVKIDKEYILRRNGKLFPIANLKQRQIESDISWILEREKKNKSIISPESVLMKLLEYTPQIISVVFSLFTLWMIFKYAPQVLDAFQRLAETINENNEPTIIGGAVLVLLKTKWF
jgi:hypothetical protein